MTFSHPASSTLCLHLFLSLSLSPPPPPLTHPPPRHTQSICIVTFPRFLDSPYLFPSGFLGPCPDAILADCIRADAPPWDPHSDTCPFDRSPSPKPESMLVSPSRLHPVQTRSASGEYRDWHKARAVQPHLGPLSTSHPSSLAPPRRLWRSFMPRGPGPCYLAL